MYKNDGGDKCSLPFSISLKPWWYFPLISMWGFLTMIKSSGVCREAVFVKMSEK
ncbi:hypothetical protein [Bacillus sp. OK048]|uniref:hypothetical protein n=1 Tax=Bacillus sp. OK048 TaxID=1882761 RepID=UPI001C31DB59|nr:hypothetical protein [Bacillus sp. OK048]